MNIVNCLKEESKYYREIDMAIEFVKKELAIEVIFAAILGSFATGLYSKSSDIDLFVIFRKEKGTAFNVKELPLNICNPEVHITFVDMRIFDKSLSELPYEEVLARYGDIVPDILKYHQKFDYNWLPGNNNCKIASFLGLIFFSALIFDKWRHLDQNLGNLKHMLNIYSFYKCWYVTAYGRLKNYLIETASVRLRSYLYTLHDVCILQHFIMKKNYFPPVRFLDALKLCDDPQVRDIALDLYQANKHASADKKCLLIDPIPMLNEYIYYQLCAIKPALLKFYHQGSHETYVPRMVY